MKILIFIFLLFVCESLFAEQTNTKSFQQHHGRKLWIMPNDRLLEHNLNGIIVYEVIRNNKPERMIIQRNVLVTERVICTEWREIQTDDGKIYRERACRLEK